MAECNFPHVLKHNLPVETVLTYLCDCVGDGWYLYDGRGGGRGIPHMLVDCLVVGRGWVQGQHTAEARRKGPW